MQRFSRPLLILLLGALISAPSFADSQQAIIEALIKRIEALEKTVEAQQQALEAQHPSPEAAPPSAPPAADVVKRSELEEQVEALTEWVQEAERSGPLGEQVKIGSYGELHYNSLDQDGEDIRELDLARMVLFFGYDFNERARFVSELEVEHVIASGGSRGAVELEQAYVELDLKPNLHLKTGLMLMPVGIINETHEPTTFYGVERPIVETTVIPTTWFSAGVGLNQHFDNGLSYDLMVTDGLKTEDPATSSSAEPFNLKQGKQKGSFADAFDLALTGRVKYTGTRGLELAAYAQYQPDIDQSAEESYADSATLLGGHVIYQNGPFSTRALYARWDLAGEEAEAAGKDVQDGGYLELGWQPNPLWGLFARQSAWSLHADESNTQTNFGVSYFPIKEVVFKADIQQQNEDAGNADGFNLGFGYNF